MATLPNPGSRSPGGALNLAMAGLVAVALAFMTYAMPQDVFSGLIARTGLPSILSAAEPPLGTKARAAVIAAGAILAFAAVLMLMRALDRVPSRPRRVAKAEPEGEGEAPRLRRADAHPDAPSRRPLLAGRDLGDYVEGGVEDDYHETFDAPPAEERFADLEVRPLPGFLVTEDAPAPPVPEPEPLLLDRREDEGGFDALVSQLPEVGEDVDDESITDLMRRLESGLSSRELAAEPVPSDQPVPPMVEQQPGFAQAPEPEQAPEHDFVPSWMQQQEPEAEPIPAAGHEHEPEPTFARAEEPEPAPSFEEARAPLEPVPPFAEPPRAEEPVDHQVGHRLRSTIGGLHKIAGRG